MAAGLRIGATTSLSSGTGFVSLWTPLVGLGMGFALATASAAALGALPAERAAVGSAVIQAVNKVGAVRGGDPGQRAQRHLPGPARPRRPASPGRERGA